MFLIKYNKLNDVMLKSVRLHACMQACTLCLVMCVYVPVFVCMGLWACVCVFPVQVYVPLGLHVPLHIYVAVCAHESYWTLRPLLWRRNR